MTYKCTYTNGHVTYTKGNISIIEAQAYYLGETFNIGSVEDNLQVCIQVEEV